MRKRKVQSNLRMSGPKKGEGFREGMFASLPDEIRGVVCGELTHQP